MGPVVENDETVPVTKASQPCKKCDVPNAQHICLQCKAVFYCSPECQKSDWLEHKADCKKPLKKWEEKPPPPPPKSVTEVLAKDAWHTIPETRVIWTAGSSNVQQVPVEVSTDNAEWIAAVGDVSKPRIAGRISVVCPTFEDRYRFHAQMYLCYGMQTHSDKELIVVCSGSKPSSFLETISANDPSVKYIHVSESLSVGAKKNLAIREHATGEMIANFDDDDVYFPAYLTTMVKKLEASKSAVVALKSWNVLDTEYGCCGVVDRGVPKPSDLEAQAHGDCCGFSMLYTYATWMCVPWPELSSGEDALMLKAVRSAGLRIEFVDGSSRGLICLKLQHGKNMNRSLCHKVQSNFKSIQTAITRWAAACQRLCGEEDAGKLLHYGLVSCKYREGPDMKPSGVHIFRDEEAYEQWKSKPKAGVHPDRDKLLGLMTEPS
eukprot:gnl/MRDRNA2_/MRDRNA2_124904_c0_seq1.p1 gnl/MRDRNA2_/MRDRNA2_124904_c0~~gnl/MRDRNA2_/MRDRNA2_124904_c0_seq1.p1  ORF type:complete len:434 (+),score=76.73 gnl/MRDRNA2_/MRDRNA2_124904_c0_seq1:114-1415(+)